MRDSGIHLIVLAAREPWLFFDVRCVREDKFSANEQRTALYRIALFILDAAPHDITQCLKVFWVSLTAGRKLLVRPRTSPYREGL